MYYSDFDKFFDNMFFGTPQFAEVKKCPRCGMTIGELNRGGLVGCAGCYDAFATELEGAFSRVQRGTGHTGKRPGRGKTGERARLREQLKAAVAAENYEEAARLRDVIKALDGGEQSGDEQ